MEEEERAAIVICWAKQCNNNNNADQQKKSDRKALEQMWNELMRVDRERTKKARNVVLTLNLVVFFYRFVTKVEPPKSRTALKRSSGRGSNIMLMGSRYESFVRWIVKLRGGRSRLNDPESLISYQYGIWRDSGSE